MKSREEVLGGGMRFCPPLCTAVYGLRTECAFILCFPLRGRNILCLPLPGALKVISENSTYKTLMLKLIRFSLFVVLASQGSSKVLGGRGKLLVISQFLSSLMGRLAMLTL